MKKIIYFDCFSGISGDMTIAALLDTGWSLEWLEEQLQALSLDGEYQLTLETVVKNGISSKKFEVHYHDHSHAHDHTEQHSHAHDHEHDHHSHTHADGHSHTHHHHGHHHRTYKDIVKLIKESELNDNVKALSLEMFRLIGEAEAKIHGVSLDTVHFHEVGAIDSIIDIVGTSIIVDALEVDQVIFSPIPVGFGHIHIDHGVYPVPAPATLEVLKGVPLAESSVKGELTTPTGAAIVQALASEFAATPVMKVEKIGYGAGTKTFKDHPNVLRVLIGEEN
ncbi:nickel pincer cofactor biosynthesis protein LarC [Gracilibacillus phocaeensis]|uniref:nickel pincer cofactor biosynthesis protein LarC n=1 Tax=Gracilibacillus phocaeensis TaxID=2042304 RepID=UPI00102FAC91|nr:nickel pincer cofactor biosynthesis protein LarC [Gracilibacillus phocaeensis]